MLVIRSRYTTRSRHVTLPPLGMPKDNFAMHCYFRGKRAGKTSTEGLWTMAAGAGRRPKTRSTNAPASGTVTPDQDDNFPLRLPALSSRSGIASPTIAAGNAVG